MSKTQRIVLLIFAAGLLVLLLFVVSLNAYYEGKGSTNRSPDKDKWGTIWDGRVYSGGYGPYYYRPDKERMLLSIGSWIVVCGVTFVLLGRRGQ
jgi:hypothetical protein